MKCRQPPFPPQPLGGERKKKSSCTSLSHPAWHRAGSSFTTTAILPGRAGHRAGGTSPPAGTAQQSTCLCCCYPTALQRLYRSKWRLGSCYKQVEKKQSSCSPHMSALFYLASARAHLISFRLIRFSELQRSRTQKLQFNSMVWGVSPAERFLISFPF